jgi:uncharacterized heparinase superfamily protein
MKAVRDALLYARTVARLRPAQVLHRLRLRSARRLIAAAPRVFELVLRRPTRRITGWPRAFQAVDAPLWAADDAAAMSQGRFRFLNVEREIGLPFDWKQPGADQLWRFNLHYFEWAWAFAKHDDQEWASKRFLEMWRSWAASAPLGRGDAWSPYVVSVRVWVMCSVFPVLVQGTIAEQGFVQDIARHAAYARMNLEMDVGGNHLIKNIKALIGAGSFLEDDLLVAKGLAMLRNQLMEQILPDGGHFERSPSYHCQVLGDLIDLETLLSCTGRPGLSELGPSIEQMRSWLVAVLSPDGDVPIFNDAALVGREKLAALGVRESVQPRITLLRSSGYIVVRPSSRLYAILDVGLPCPDSLPAHAHADCLSFELSFDGKRVIVDSGTSTYAPGWRREYERSTRAHNTLEIDGEDQTEVWGTFRAARRAHPCLEAVREEGDAVTVTAAHDGYERLAGRPRHRRTWLLQGNSISVEDEVTGRGIRTLTSRLFVAPGVTMQSERIGNNSVRLGPFVATLDGASLEVNTAETAMQFGALEPTHCLVGSIRHKLPHHLMWRIVLAREEEDSTTT